MAELWVCKKGEHPTAGTPAAVCPFAECKQLLQLGGHLYLGHDAKNVHFGLPGDRLASIRGRDHVVVALADEEAKTAGWKPGYYYSPLSPQEAFELLGL